MAHAALKPRGLAGVFLPALLLACSAPTAARTAAPASAPVSGVEPLSSFSEKGWGRVVSGGRVRQCIVMVYATRADGPDAETVAAERLGFVVDRVFARVESRTIEDRAAPSEGR